MRPIACLFLAISLVGGACSGAAIPSASVAPATSPDRVVPSAPVEQSHSPSLMPSVASVVSVSPIERAPAFPTTAFADIREESVSEDAAAEFEAILSEAAGAGGMTATVMTAAGTWSGAAGTADGVRDMRPDDQLAIGSVTKSVIAAQVMQLIDAGELALDDRATDHLPAELDFDTNGATIRHLLGMSSGIPDYVDELWGSLLSDRQRSWTSADVLESVPVNRSPAGNRYQYSSTNYVLLGLIIEQVRGRRLAGVLRDGVLSGEGVERLVFQPDEAPTEPMAMPHGQSTAALETGGGYLPSLAAVTAAGPAGAMASDSASLARWWSRLCGGELVSEASLTEMATVLDGEEYGLGLFDGMAEAHDTPSVGHGGIQVGFAAWAMCFIEDGSVVVVLANRADLGMTIEIADALAGAARSD
jgi:D-alanyl-D-alanine carboxypeptidase